MKRFLMPGERNLALNKIWRDDNYFSREVMDVILAKLRKVFKKFDDTVEILTFHGEGF